MTFELDSEPAPVARLGRTKALRSVTPVDDWRTPAGLFVQLDREFFFTIDVAADRGNALCFRFFDSAVDALVQPWAPARCWMNPPYSDIGRWTNKAALEARRGALVVGLLPARTDLDWFHRDVIAAEAEVRFVRGRLRFSGRYNAPFASIVVVWRPVV